ncbi:aminoglycoside phosphotransferase family protein [Streptomyces fuscigenes]|uniref:aminoglycoside phosphotransferase family protein n=1 Tax=Streptomyces fuscigenes TaxID=1528880 RepID=UPI001F250DD1|nr:aminoglycoside phosphotransferase family protein [Streptomyces fuscigenes]MCF3963158.1 aminoglycoside phosphotransferase family protein [Streptomyces fuscigenes]
MAFEPPRRLVTALTERYGAPAARSWLADLPDLAERAVAVRGLDVERAVAPGGRDSLVLLVRRPGAAPATLKIAPPFAAPGPERAALAHWKGWGAVETFDARETPEDGSVLLERLRPEVSLRSLPEAKALLEAAGTVRRLWVEPPAGHGFETVEERTLREAAAMESSDAPGELVAEALRARAAMTASADERLLLHGAFRQGKVLAGERAPWLAVGPEPVVGERAYDLARLARDRVEDLIAADTGASSARRRINRLADSLEVDRERLRAWTLYRAVESATRALRVGREREAELLLEYASWL